MALRAGGHPKNWLDDSHGYDWEERQMRLEALASRLCRDSGRPPADYEAPEEAGVSVQHQLFISAEAPAIGAEQS